LRPGFAGALSYVGGEQLFAQAGQLRYDRPLRPEAKLFEGGMLSSVSCAALAAAVPLLLELGVAAIYTHVNGYLDALEAGLVARGFRSLRAADAARRSCTLGVVPVATAHSASALASRLTARGVVCSGPDGVLRFTPHWANALSEVEPVLAAVDAALSAR
jgi:selenocysteine lyase/cysteine desulfurase